ncbi:lethal(3)malignant brain tumor-like protein 3 isoform X2 [Amia ocellicauda]|uniref:lethal(3)malignant brain tumor-like protein 3 isoform X2 n=1 Tax=Amia ocellicauda TaxID=2972642 RepID=UPI003464A800
MDESSSNIGAQDFDVYSAMDWKDGVGTLPGSELKFRQNEFGVLEVITDESEVESVKKAHATTTWTVPTVQEAFSASQTIVRDERLSTRAHTVCCTHCHQKGLPHDFLPEGNFCSEKCLQQSQEVEQRPKKDVPKPNGEIFSSTRKRKIQLPANLKEESIENGDHPREEEDESEERPDRKTARAPQRTRRKRRGDAALLKQTVPYGGKKKSWSWASYLEKEKAIAAPSKLFKEHQSFPHNKNGFKVGLKLEGVDPEHPSMYCVLTVAEVLGHRIRLHFDKYSDCYDFWVNANSADIHPVGWCEKTGHKLHPPKGMKEEDFNWQSYIKLCKAQAAPKALFENQNTTVTPLGFRIGMKLEAVDKKNPTFICVATVTDMVDSRFLVHFDNWDESYDYWCDATSPYIHPVGWCKDNGKILTTPPDYPNAKTFSWERYLDETNSLPAPARAFKVKPPHGFPKYAKLEAVDKRNPMLIRVVTIIDTDDHRILIHFDGWSDEYDYWVDTDSPDIHPAGWCAKTGHPLQPPISPQEMFESSEQGGCPTPGCKGVGHIKGARYSGHHSAVGCPYSDININRDSVLPDRLSGEMPTASLAMPKNRKGEPSIEPTCPTVANISSNQNNHSKTSGLQKLGAEETNGEPPPKKPTLCDNKGKKHNRVGRPCKQRKIEEELEEAETESEVSSITETKESEEMTLQQALHQSVFMPSTSPLPSLPLCWEQHSKLLPTVAGITASKVAEWTVEEVTEFIHGLPGCKEQVKTFREEQIDGEAFLLLTQVDLVKIMSIKLGPALKIYNSILMFKTAENSYNEL